MLQALDHELGRLVALKVRPSGNEEPSLLTEARILLGLEPHPLLCRVREDFFAGDRYFLVTDWVEGTTLAAVVREAGGMGLPLDDAVPTSPRWPRRSTTSTGTGRPSSTGT